ncbi:uncharacterized protein LOC142768346 [Rhipicephalus microplus]|uniref:uncharacterized protein LOC142768346 n=1 Tax=Rhipicephalus microplus TaxID=6941 RepID=UPI003F6C99BE
MGVLHNLCMANPSLYVFFQALIWLPWHQPQHTLATNTSYLYQPWIVTDETPDWGCPNHSTICNLICKSSGKAFGYCNGNQNTGGCSCFDKTEVRKGILKKTFTKQNGLEQLIFPKVPCWNKISPCDVVCVKTKCLLAMCGGRRPGLCNCYYKNGTALESVRNAMAASSSSTAMASVSEELLHSRCPKTRGPCDWYCLVLGSLFGYCALDGRKCICVSSKVLGTSGGFKYYKDGGTIVKGYDSYFVGS